MQKQRFSLRKYKFGLASVLLGIALVFGGGQVQAEEQAATNPASTSQLVTSEPGSSGETAEAATPAETNTVESSASVEPAAEASYSASQVTGQEEAASSQTPKNDITTAEAATTPVETSSQTEKTAQAETAPASETSTTAAETLSEKAAPSAQTSTAEKTTTAPEKDDRATSSQAVEKERSSADQTATTKEEVKDSTAETPSSISSNEIIKVPETWNLGYKGAGTVVAVIDSGLDTLHQVLRISDPTKAKYQTEAALEEAKKKANINYGKWYNDKVVFAYNYIDGDDSIKEADSYSHGMHVTGIATGNPDKIDANGEYIYGVAPEAQVMFMRVFSDRVSTTSDSIYIKAIDDAVALGADTINMSLGSATGSTVNASPSLLAAIERARAKGVSVVIAAGNNNTFGNGHSKPSAENPDYGLVGNPSTAEQSISVASVNNSVITEEVLEVRGLESNADLNHGKFNYTTAESDGVFEKDKEYEYVAVGLGREGDFEGLNLTGKLALIQRGEIAFSDKVTNAVKHGAIGAVIYNNVAGANVQMALDGQGKTVPAVFISKEYGEALAAGNYKLVFNGNKDNRPNPAADQLSSFTSWGVTTDGRLKPDVTAPGGSIYSSLNDDTYGNMSGTSMAAPHVAGVAALVKEALLKNYPDLTPAQNSELVKALIMSTAKPHLNKETGAYTSPRQQGAGIVDTAAAVSTGLYVTSQDGYPSLSLGNVEDSFSFDVTIHNITDQDRTLKTIVNTNTDQVENGYFSLTPRKLTETVWPEVTVKAHSSQTVTIKVDASKFAQELSQLMPNGYFLEGFVRFVDPADDGHVVGLPFMGFRGEFQNLPATEKPIYQLISDGKSGFYYQVPEDKSITARTPVTALLTNSSDKLYSTGKDAARSPIVLGSVTNEAGINSLELGTDGLIRLAFSPNGDNNKDLVQFRSVFYRNVNNLTASVYTSDDLDYQFPIWQSTDAWDGRKNFYDNDPRRSQSYLIASTAWNGLDSNGEALDDGLYTYVVRYTPDVPGAEEQVVSFQLQIDTQKPQITSAYVTLEDGKEILTVRKPKDIGNGGILREQLFYLQAGQDGQVTYQAQDDLGNVRDYEHRVYITANEDGTYTLPEGIEKANLYYLVEDYAGNKDALSLAELVGEENNGRIRVSLVDVDTYEEVDTSFVYRIKDDQGNYVTLDKGKTINFLPFGHYVAEIFTYDRDEIKFYADKTQEFTISAEDSFKSIEFLVKEVVFEPVSVQFNQALPKETAVILKNNDGDRFVLPAQRYGKNAFGRSVATGIYDIEIILPEGYELWDVEPTVEVVKGKNNRIQLTLVVKTSLIAAVKKQAETVLTAQYYNASAEKRNKYDLAYQAASLALASKLNQEQVDQALANLEEALASLDGKESDVAALKAAMEAYAATTKTGAYVNAKEKIQQQYDRAFQALALLLIQDQISQEQINQALSQLEAAEQKLNGKETDFTSLKKLLDSESSYQASNAKFIYASETVKAAYLQAFQDAKAVLEDSSSSQEQVKAAIKKLKASKKKLNGKKPKPVKAKKGK